MDHTSLYALAAMSANDSTQNIIRQAPATSAPSATSRGASQDMRPNPLASHSLCAQHYGSSDEPRTGAPAVKSSNDASNGGGFTYKW